MRFEYFLKSFKPTGWFYQDVLLCGGLILFILLALFLLHKKIKKEGFLIFICCYLFFFSFIGICFAGFLSNIRYSTESDVFYLEEEKQLLSLVRASIPNGVENGISTSISHFELILINSETGKKQWTKRMTWRHYLLGTTSKYIIMNNPDRNWLYFLDLKTGKRIYSQKELEQENEQLSGILSDSFTDYYIKDDMIYMFGNDNHYYKIDANDLHVEEITKEVFSDRPSNDLESFSFPSEDMEYLQQELIQPIFLSKNSTSQYYVLSSQKRQNSKSYISLYDTKTHSILWQLRIDFPADSNMDSIVDSSDAIYLQGNGKLYRINKESQKVDYVFNYRFNKIEKE